jgi:hypothetical protein
MMLLPAAPTSAAQQDPTSAKSSQTHCRLPQEQALTAHLADVAQVPTTFVVAMSHPCQDALALSKLPIGQIQTSSQIFNDGLPQLQLRSCFSDSSKNASSENLVAGQEAIGEGSHETITESCHSEANQDLGEETEICANLPTDSKPTISRNPPRRQRHPKYKIKWTQSEVSS